MVDVTLGKVERKKQTSRLNIAETELSALTMQCLDRRIPDIETLPKEAKALETKRNGL
jgi:hypothetical protein